MGCQKAATTSPNQGALAKETPKRVKKDFIEILPATYFNKKAALQSMANESVKNHQTLTPYFFFSVDRKWKKQLITVAFNGGSELTCKAVEEASRDWTFCDKDGCPSLKFDFGYNSSTHKYRQWSPADKDYAADIRISFTEPGYWSFIGWESIDPAIATPGQPSMSLQGFDKGLPPDYRAIVLHEFGHALGLQHEHQRPDDGCENEFLLEPDPGYITTFVDTDYGKMAVNDQNGLRPGLYLYLEHAPNNWTKEVIDLNLKHIELNTRAFAESAKLDKHSIMMYSFPASFYKEGANSRCYTEENMNLSKEDKQGISRAYPAAQAAVEQDTYRSTFQSLLKSVGRESISGSNVEGILKRVFGVK